jgi:hypothetical protein
MPTFRGKALRGEVSISIYLNFLVVLVLPTPWPEITDKMAANSISYAHNELILRNQDGGYYTVFYYRKYKIDAHNKI